MSSDRSRLGAAGRLGGLGERRVALGHAVLALGEQQWGAVEPGETLDPADEDVVIAAVEDGFVDTLQVCDGAHHQRGAASTCSPLHLGELVRSGRPNNPDTSIWSSARMLMPKCPFCRNAGPLLDSLRMDHSTSGGSSETAEKEFTTIPTSWSSALVVTTVTPVANWPRARRNARASSVGSP